MSQNAWALRLGLSKSYLSQMVNGRRLYPGRKVRRRLLEALDLDFEELFQVENRNSRSAQCQSGYYRTLTQLSWRGHHLQVRHRRGATAHDRKEAPMGQLGQDFRFALRVLNKNRWVSLIAILALALGIGGNTAIFSVVNGVVLQPLPYPDSQELVQVMRGHPRGNNPWVSVPFFFHWKANSRTLKRIAAYEQLGTGFNLTGEGSPERLTGVKVTQEFFRVFKSPPALGRDFQPQDDQPGAAKTVILSHGLWQRRFGGDRSVIGQSIILNEAPYVVVGVAARGFRYPAHAELWTPGQYDPSDQSRANYIYATARLGEGSGLSEARAELDLLARQFYAAHPDWAVSPGDTTTAQQLQEFLYGDLRPSLLLLLAAVGLVLMIACANVANLQLARSTGRRKEIAIRRALGARSRRIFRQLLTESVVLSLLGGVLGVALCAASLGPLLSLSPLEVPRLQEVGLDAPVLLFTLLLSILTGVLFGLAPAFQASRLDLNESLQKGSLRTTGGKSGGRFRVALVVSEIALAVLLMIGASLLLRNFAVLSSVDPGFEPSGVLTFKLSLSGERYSSSQDLERLTGQLLPKIAGIAGVSQSAASIPLPMEPGPDLPFVIEGRRKPGTDEGIGSAYYRPVTEGYFEVLSIPLRRGRRLSESDRHGSQLVAVINEEAARLYWPEQDPLGQRVHIGMPEVPELADAQPRTIVGVVGSVRLDGLDQPAPPVIYVPLSQVSEGFAPMLIQLLPLSLAVRSETPSGSLAQAVQEQIWSVDPNQPASDIRPLSDNVARTLGEREFNMVLMSTLAAMALLLSAVGIYGVISYLVTGRTREIGIRMALGAGHAEILGLVIGQWMKAVLLGVALGLAGAAAAVRLLSGLIAGVASDDWLTFLAVPIVFILVALAATYLPARRATRVPPTTALRWE
ncbi:MAG TPA: ADOP family duplicated permease [Acidobacteriota bacterium]|nr:ADOP family duplicated permease [Acidobacteriota bacterium]